MILVYEYMPSGNLAGHLHKRVRKGDTSLPPLSWVQRLKICVGAAHGLEYLHTGTSIENRVIHRDVKTTNILLDENLAARISDFGLSKTGPANQTCTYVSTRVKGTPGYLDPYYVSTHRLTRKSDVYAFGVVLFEVLCGRRAVDTSLNDEQMNLAGWAQHCFKEGLLDQITDPNIKGVLSPDSLNAYVDIAIKCLHYQPKHRPTMAEVVVGLESALTLQKKSIEGRLPLDWQIRYNIISGIAKGILYLHQDSRPRVILRDLSASSILLDSEMNPRISDFGFARIFEGSESELNTMALVGTYRYMFPEYALHGIFSVKSDVYSFGIIMLEIISGLKMGGLSNLDTPNLDLLSTHAWRLYQEERCLELLDKKIIGSYNQSELLRAIQVGLLCVQTYPEDRPSMSMVVLMLSSNIKLPQPKQPAFSQEETNLQCISSINLSENISSTVSLSSSVFIPR